MKKLNLFLLVAAFFVAAFFRFYHLANLPAGFHVDEAIIGANANFILHTARDTNNSFLPLQTEVFKDYNPTGYAYLAILPIKLMGLNEFATRLPGALLNCMTVFAIFLLVYAILESFSIAILSAVFFALSPWDIVISRSSEERAASLFFVVLGFALLIYSVKKEKIMYLLASFFVLALSYFMYFTPRVFVPLFFAAFFIPWKYWWKKRKTKFVKLFFCAFVILGLTATLLLMGVQGGSNRFKQVSIFGFPETKLVQEEQIREDGVMNTPVLVTRTFHNKIIAYGYTYVSNYLRYFSSDFLFMKGGLPIWFSVPQMGLVYLIELPFILFGMHRFFIEKKKWSFLLFAWLFLAPVAASFTADDSPNVRRSLLLVPAIEAFAAYGMIRFFVMIPKKLRKIFLAFVLLLFIFNIGYFMHAYFVHSTIHRNWYRNQGYNRMINEVKKVYTNYDHIIISKSTGNYSEVLFYMNYNPAAYLKEGAPKDAEYKGFGKFFFVPADCPFDKKDKRLPKGKNLYVEDGRCSDTRGTAVKQMYIKLLDGTPVFLMVYE